MELPKIPSLHLARLGFFWEHLLELFHMAIPLLISSAISDAGSSMLQANINHFKKTSRALMIASHGSSK
jgi:hypothetical protein